jgi:hypothetical protein
VLDQVIVFFCDLSTGAKGGGEVEVGEEGVGEEVEGEGGGVREALEGRIHVAGVAEIEQANATTTGEIEERKEGRF